MAAPGEATGEPVTAAAADPAPAGRRPPLSREVILAAALRVVDEDGLDALTMRRLGKELDRDPMALYRHAINRAALLDGVVEYVLDQLLIPTRDGGWQAQLRRTATDFRNLCLAHPNVAPLLVTRPPATPLGLCPIGTLRPLEQLLDVLIDAGFAPVLALHVYRAYFALLYGYILSEIREKTLDPEESLALLRIGLRRLPPTDFVHIRGLETELGDHDGAAELELGLDILLTGIEHTLDTPPR
jgi:AcrR family transcriptional regulator